MKTVTFIVNPALNTALHRFFLHIKGSFCSEKLKNFWRRFAALQQVFLSTPKFFFMELLAQKTPSSKFSFPNVPHFKIRFVARFGIF